jgi:transcription-repair coupling factor (superfamily II helicase)
MKGDVAVEREPADVTSRAPPTCPTTYIADAAQKLHLYRRLSRLEQAADVRALHAEIRDRYGPPPPEVVPPAHGRAAALLGTALGVDRISSRATPPGHVPRGASPRMTDLQKAFRDHQVEVEVRRPVPLSIVFRRAGAAAIDDVLASGLETLAAGWR